VEHALVALGLLGLGRGASRWGPVVLGLSCAGFAVHGAFLHEQLRDRDGARTTFDAELLSSARLGVTIDGKRPTVPTLVLVDTDAAFDLAHDPAAVERAADDVARGKAPNGLFVARARGDDHDRLLYDRLGHPQSWTYRPKPAAPGTVADLAHPDDTPRPNELSLWTPTATWAGGAETWRFEGESMWPPLAQSGGAWAEPVWMTDSCASPPGNGRALALHVSASPGGSVAVSVPVPRAGSWLVTPRFALGSALASPAAELRTKGGAVLASWREGEAAAASGAGAVRCVDFPGRLVLAPDGHEIELIVSLSPEPGPFPAPPGGAAKAALDRVIVAASSR
jgi:hypothetical protein